MNRNVVINRSPARWRRRAVAGALAAACCLFALPSLAADGLVEECLLAGRVARVDAGSVGKQVHVEFRDVRSTAAAPCRMDRPQTVRRVEFRVNQDRRLLAGTAGSRVLYRYRRFEDGDITWEAVAGDPRARQ